MKPRWLIAVSVCVLLITLANARAQPVFHTVESIESTVANADVVVVGTVAESANVEDGIAVTLAVEETLKGEHRDRQRVGIPVGTLNLTRAKERPGQLLVALREGSGAATRIIDLSGQGPEVFADDFTLLKEPADVIQAARAMVRRMPGVRRIEGFPLVVPTGLLTGTRCERAYGPGTIMMLEVPVDERLEKRAHDYIASKSYRDRAEGARALRYFKSEENVARARALLADPEWGCGARAEENRGVEVRVYGVRQAAYQTLQSWGVHVAEPQIREEIVNLDRAQVVDMSNTPVTGADLAKLARFKNLEHLYLRNIPLTDAYLSRLAALKSLQSLDLGGTGVTDAGLPELTALSNLRYLSLRSTKVTGAGLRALAGLVNLTSLDLAQTKVTDAGLEHLAGLKGLRTLDLSESKVSAEGARELLRRRPEVKLSR